MAFLPAASTSYADNKTHTSPSLTVFCKQHDRSLQDHRLHDHGRHDRRSGDRIKSFEN